jgi:hypothetical protein
LSGFFSFFLFFGPLTDLGEVFLIAIRKEKNEQQEEGCEEEEEEEEEDGGGGEEEEEEEEEVKKRRWSKTKRRRSKRWLGFHETENTFSSWMASRSYPFCVRRGETRNVNLKDVGCWVVFCLFSFSN